MQKEKTISVLNDLINISEDGQKGFKEAAEVATDGKLKTLFQQAANDCARSITELQQAVHSLGGKPETSGSVAGAAHRGWIKVKSAVEDKNIAILEEVERGQDHAKAAYTKALKENIEASAHTLIERQAAGAKQHHDQVRDLRNAYKAAA